jgi:hypothetical protein
MGDTDNQIALMADLGWTITDTLPEPIANIITPLVALQERLDTGDIAETDVIALINDLQLFITAVLSLSSEPDESFPSTVDITEFKNEFPKQLISLLIVEYLADNRPIIYQLLKLLGIIKEIKTPATATRPAYEKCYIEWSYIGIFLSRPDAILTDFYQWGGVDFKGRELVKNMLDVADEIGAYEFYEDEPSDAFIDYVLDHPIPDDADSVTAVYFPLLEDDSDPVELEFGLGLYVMPRSEGSNRGVVLFPYGTGLLEVEEAITEQFALFVSTGFDVEGGIGLTVRPETGLEAFFNIFAEGDSVDPTNSSNFIEVGLRNQQEAGARFVLLGNPDASRFDLDLISLKIGIRFIQQQPDFFVELELSGASIVIKPTSDDADSFLSSLLSEDGFAIDFDLVTGLSHRQGLYFEGSGGLEINIPAHIDLGIIEILNSVLRVKIDEEGIPIELGASIKGNLGALSAVVENIGLRADISFPENADGNLGVLDFRLGFKPPNGVGLAIDAGVVKGGGYLYFDFDKEEYAGMLELDLNGIVSVKAIGLITTRMPDGSKGFSLLLIITAEFGSPIQLGLGFTLSAVGGLLGLNRTMRLEVIATGIRDGGINSIMFPQNVIENAPRIISDLKKYFPVEEDIFLIGPMVKIGWGTPNLVTVSLGIIIEIPGNIAILGVLKVTLPDEDAAVIVIQVNFMGAIEFDKKRLWFFASLFDSRVLFLTLEGQMGLLVGWGDDASFLVSVGGFHPAFNPPPLPFGAIVRIAISILNTDFARIRVEGYFAVTSNSVQFGAKVEIFFGISAFNIDGHLAFDALFRFSPFYFIISISASLSVKVFGVGLFSVRMRGSLEGPTPWHVEGTGSISILFFDIDVDFSHTWGNEAETTLPPISVMPLLVDEYQKPENWRAVLPASNQLLVSLRSFEQGTTDLILHPVGSLKISQRAVPLGMTIDKVGNQKPSDANHFNVTVSTTGIDEKGDVEESFAVGQYFAISDNELLNAKSFEPMKGGVELSVAGEQYHAPEAVKRVVRYERIVIDTHFKRFVKKFYTWFGSLFSLFLNGNAVSQSAISYKQQKTLKPFADRVEIGKPLYTVAFDHDNTAFNDDAMAFSSQVQAQEFMNQQIAGDANLAQQLHVIPQVEMQRAA